MKLHATTYLLLVCTISLTGRSVDSEKVKTIKHQCKDQQIQFVEYSFTDLLGNSKSLTRPLHYLEKDIHNGIAFDGSSIIGGQRITESDMLLKPDLDSVTSLPWTDNVHKTVRLTCDMYIDDTTPYESDPRNILKKVMQKAQGMGYEFLVGPELEFYLFKTDAHGESQPYDEGTYFNVAQTYQDDVTKTSILNILRAIGIPVEKIHHEVGPGQYEVSIAYTNALQMADFISIAKHALKGLEGNGIKVTFMPKPLSEKAGSGMHIHFSLFDRENNQNVFYDENDPDQLSTIAKSFIAGVLFHAKEITLLLNPSINSYKRLVPGHEAPINICCGKKNRSALIRLPQFTEQQPEAVRAEIRSPDPLCNPYLAFAALLSAGLDGIEQQMTLPTIVSDNLYALNWQELAERGIEFLPSSMHAAFFHFKDSALIQELLGTNAYESYLKAKWDELTNFNATITDWEMARYF